MYLRSIALVAEKNYFLKTTKIYICPLNEIYVGHKPFVLTKNSGYIFQYCVCTFFFLPPHLSWKKKIQNSSSKIKIPRNLSPRWWFWSVVPFESYERSLPGSKYFTLGEIIPHRFGVKPEKCRNLQDSGQNRLNLPYGFPKSRRQTLYLQKVKGLSRPLPT